MLKFGISSYSLSRAVAAGEMTFLEMIGWVADNGGQHLEIVPIGFDLIKDAHLIDGITAKAKEVGVDISNYAIGANFIKDSKAEIEAEIETVKRHVDVAAKLGVKLMRHDVASRPIPDCTSARFDADLPLLAEACAAVADYALQYGITTSVENHGFYIQAFERVQRLVQTVNRPNFRTTLDVGNFMCADENSTVSVKQNIGIASMVHLKDFYLRPSYLNPGDGWFKTLNGNYLRGAIFGQGDIDMREVIRIIKGSGYEGYVSLEFEGMEDCKLGTKIGFDNVLRLFQEA